MAKDKTIPIIDVSPYLSQGATQSAKDKVINEVRDACSTYGFLQVKGHGVPVDVQRRMLGCCKTLFDLPDEDKEKLSLKNSPSRRGYEKLGEQVLDSKALPDNKEGFYIGREVPASEMSFLRGPNQWPALPDSDFHTPVTEYYNHMLHLSTALIQILIQALGHPVKVLDTFTREPVMNLKLLHYPPHTSKDPLQFGAGEHTDFGALTILLQQPDAPGLQVRDITSGSEWPNEKWLDVPAVEDVFVVNIGDLIHKWTGGKFQSTLHRVTNRGDGDRYSVPCFFQGNLEARNPFDGQEGGNGETVGEHIRKKFEGSYGLGGDEKK